MKLKSQQLPTRRNFFKQVGLVCAATSLPLKKMWGLPTTIAPQPVIKNRAPLAESAFYPMPLGAIRPRGWLRRQLQIQANGLGGHLDEFWKDVGPNSGWLGGTGESWERGPYFLDGLLPLAYQLDDPRLKAKAQKFIDWTLDHPQPNGMFGPISNNDWWPRIVMLKALTQYYDVTQATTGTPDPRVIPLMEKYFVYQLKELPNRPLRDWGRFRWQDELLSVLWLYNRNGDPNLLKLAALLHQQGFDWIAQFANFKFTERTTPEFLKFNQGQGLKDLDLSVHGVNNGQAVKSAPLWSLVTGTDTDRRAGLHMITQLNQYHGLPNGMFSCDEHLAGLNPSQGSELCTVVEYMFSLEVSLAILGDVSLGDRLEQLAFNALPGTFTDDMWAHQYDQEPNQVESSLHSKPWTSNSAEANLFGLEPNYGCCTANFPQGWPKFTNSLFMLSGKQNSSAHDGIVAAAYAPCEVHTLVRGTAVHLIEETNYPFHGTVRITVTPSAALDFPLQCRIPAWATGTKISVNGTPQPTPTPNTFATITRTWKSGDVVDIDFAMQPRASRWFNNSIAIERGPLVFSYGIGEDWVKLRDRGMTADWQVYPTTPWNYALLVNPDSPAADITVTETEVGTGPLTRRNTPIKLHVKARKLPDWRAVDGVANPLPASPVASAEPIEEITLIPYAAAKLRITAFPLNKKS